MKYECVADKNPTPAWLLHWFGWSIKPPGIPKHFQMQTIAQKTSFFRTVLAFSWCPSLSWRIARITADGRLIFFGFTGWRSASRFWAANHFYNHMHTCFRHRFDYDHIRSITSKKLRPLSTNNLCLKGTPVWHMVVMCPITMSEDVNMSNLHRVHETF